MSLSCRVHSQCNQPCSEVTDHFRIESVNQRTCPVFWEKRRPTEASSCGLSSLGLKGLTESILLRRDSGIHVRVWLSSPRRASLAQAERKMPSPAGGQAKKGTKQKVLPVKTLTFKRIAKCEVLDLQNAENDSDRLLKKKKPAAATLFLALLKTTAKS